MRMLRARDQVVELRDAPQSSVGAPLPRILAEEGTAVLACVVETNDPEGWRGYASASGSRRNNPSGTSRAEAPNSLRGRQRAM
jgi:hypothetical protein